MAKDNLRQYDSTAANNTDVGGVNTDEGMSPSSVNNAIRELMSHLAEFADGTEGITALTFEDGASDWKFRVASNNLIISYGGTDKMKLDTSGNLTVVGDVTAFGTI